jgi:hypothetical protein
MPHKLKQPLPLTKRPACNFKALFESIERDQIARGVLTSA